MDEIARRYLLLGLRLGRLQPGFVDSYVGPRDLAEAVAVEPTPIPQDLHDEALALQEAVESLARTEPLLERRRRWLRGQLRAIAALARVEAGEELRYVELVEELFGVRVAPVPEDELLRARRVIDEAIPGREPLAERIHAFRERLLVPAERVLDAVRASAERFREATRRDFELPPDEGIDWVEAHDQPWGAYASFRGNGRTRIEVNIDLPLDVGGVGYLASHEAYPGHHAEHVVKEESLIRTAALGEATLRTMNTPESMLAEGQADVAREIVMGDFELEAELRRIGRAAGVEGDWAAAVAVRRASLDLSAYLGNAALMLYQDGRGVDEVRDWIRELTAQPEDRVAHAMRILADPVNRTYAFTYTEGARLIRVWLETQGQTTGFWRLLSEQHSPASLQAELTAAAAG